MKLNTGHGFGCRVVQIAAYHAAVRVPNSLTPFRQTNIVGVVFVPINNGGLHRHAGLALACTAAYVLFWGTV